MPTEQNLRPDPIVARMQRKLLAAKKLIAAVALVPYRLYRKKGVAEAWDAAVYAFERGNLNEALRVVRSKRLTNWEREIVPFGLLEGQLLLSLGKYDLAIEALSAFLSTYVVKRRWPSDETNYLAEVATGLMLYAKIGIGENDAEKLTVSCSDWPFDVAKVPTHYKVIFPLPIGESLPSKARAKNLWARAIDHFFRGEYAELEKEVRVAREILGGAPEFLALLGLAMEGVGDDKRAIRCFYHAYLALGQGGDLSPEAIVYLRAYSGISMKRVSARNGWKANMEIPTGPRSPRLQNVPKDFVMLFPIPEPVETECPESVASQLP